MKTNLADITGTVSDAVGDAWSAGAHRAHDLATTTADRAASLATATAHQVPELPERMSDLVDTAKRRWGPQPKRHVSPWLLAAAAMIAFVAAGWWMRRRRSVDVDDGPGGSVNPARKHTSRAEAAAGN
ncbi:MAG: hypothetical protein M3487_02550 [Actinomycetota bacterium]|nr:hypothetical protein [Acidimicrobiia bacterium]MDQ3468646.1 hypothetical protein [Actinomycetota bacterium]